MIAKFQVQLLDLGRGGGLIYLDGFLLVAALVAFDKGFLIRAAGWTDIDPDIEARQEADEGGREITTGPTAHEARITVEGDLLGTDPLAQGIK